MQQYITGLNGIRAIAVLFVIISHRFSQEHVLNTFPLGDYGVNTFFVLSGFLISRGLFLNLKTNANNFYNNFRLLKTFITKRFLRIFPIYYALLLFMYLTSGIIGNNFKENIWWYVLYCANYLNFLQDRWFGALAHLWSLSVEEQFYVFFPILLIFFFRNRILFLLIMFIVVGTIYPFFIEGNSNILTLSCINSFGVGGLLAFVEIHRNTELSTFYKYARAISLPICLLMMYHNLFFKIPYFSERLAISILAIFLIALCLLKENTFVVRKILSNKFLNYVGIISYGVYLYHNIVPKYWGFVLSKIGFKFGSGGFSYFEFFLQTGFIIILSHFSWILFEKPILNLKKYLIK